MPRPTPRSTPPPSTCTGCSVYVTHEHLRTTSDRQQQIREMAVAATDQRNGGEFNL